MLWFKSKKGGKAIAEDQITGNHLGYQVVSEAAEQRQAIYYEYAVGDDADQGNGSLQKGLHGVVPRPGGIQDI